VTSVAATDPVGPMWQAGIVQCKHDSHATWRRADVQVATAVSGPLSWLDSPLLWWVLTPELMQ
jgi:hypothetical protein